MIRLHPVVALTSSTETPGAISFSAMPSCGDLEQPEIGDDEIDDAARRHRDGAALDEARRAARVVCSIATKTCLAQAARSIAPPMPPPFWPGHLPVREIAVLGDLVGAEHGHVDAAAADHRERVGVVHDRRARVHRHVLAAGVDEVQVLLAGRGERAVADRRRSRNGR